MIISMVVAMGENRVIGRDGGLPWHIPGDLKLFKQTTMGKPIIMGRKTWESLGQPLPGRPHVVITRDRNYKTTEANVVHNLNQALSVAKGLAVALKEEEIMIIGGADIYRLAMAKAKRLYLTEVALSPMGDAFFPDFDVDQWQEMSRTTYPSSNGAASYSLVIREKIVKDSGIN
jgi:dihydrofolate reductase